VNDCAEKDSQPFCPGQSDVRAHGVSPEESSVIELETEYESVHVMAASLLG